MRLLHVPTHRVFVMFKDGNDKVLQSWLKEVIEEFHRTGPKRRLGTKSEVCRIHVTRRINQRDKAKCLFYRLFHALPDCLCQYQDDTGCVTARCQLWNGRSMREKVKHSA